MYNPMPPEPLSDDAFEFIDTIVNDSASRGLPRTRPVLKALLTKPKSDFQKALQMDITENPNKVSEVVNKTSPDDFRAFLRDEILSKEKDHIATSIAQLRDDPETYNKTLQGWAKIALPNQNETNINVDIRQKADMYLRIKEQYGLSKAVDEAELLPDFGAALPQPDIEELDEPTQEPKAIMVEESPEYEEAEQTDISPTMPDPTPIHTPRFDRRASTFDPAFFEIPQDTTPVGDDEPPY